MIEYMKSFVYFILNLVWRTFQYQFNIGICDDPERWTEFRGKLGHKRGFFNLVYKNNMYYFFFNNNL